MKTRDLANGRWPSILAALGVDADVLDGRHHPCPRGEGKDRFRFSDRHGCGNYFCACSDGSKSGFDLLMCVNGWSFAEACRQVEAVAETAAPAPTMRKADPRKSLRSIAKACKPVGFAVRRYLANRGLYPAPALREARLMYWDNGKKIGVFACMVALVHGADGSPQTYHVTYLDGVAKANIPSPRKVMTPIDTITGGAIRLYPESEHMGIAEGIETAIAASMLHSLPVWAAVSAHGVESFQPPSACRRLTIFGDRDPSFTGQAAAYALAKRMKRLGVSADVRMPDAGDWNDVLIAQRKVAV